MQTQSYGLGFHTRHRQPPTISLRPMNPDNARPLRITAAAGTYLAGASSTGTVTSASSPLKAVYNPKAVIPHAASLPQACAHWARFPTAASRRSLGRVSVPVWPSTLSGRLPVAALVGHYPTNKLIGRGPIPNQNPSPKEEAPFQPPPCSRSSYPVLAPVSQRYPEVKGRSPTRYSPVRR